MQQCDLNTKLSNVKNIRLQNRIKLIRDLGILEISEYLILKLKGRVRKVLLPHIRNLRHKAPYRHYLMIQGLSETIIREEFGNRMLIYTSTVEGGRAGEL